MILNIIKMKKSSVEAQTDQNLTGQGHTDQSNKDIDSVFALCKKYFYVKFLELSEKNLRAEKKQEKLLCKQNETIPFQRQRETDSIRFQHCTAGCSRGYTWLCE